MSAPARRANYAPVGSTVEDLELTAVNPPANAALARNVRATPTATATRNPLVDALDDLDLEAGETDPSAEPAKPSDIMELRCLDLQAVVARGKYGHPQLVEATRRLIIIILSLPLLC